MISTSLSARRLGSVLVAALALSCVGVAGCSRALYRREPCQRPDLGGCVVEDVDIVGNARVRDADVKEHIATAETSRAFGGALENVPILSVWDRATVDYERFDRLVLERDLARVERYYRSRGFYEARARAARVIRRADGTVRVEIAVDEGPVVTLRSVRVVPKDWRPPPPEDERTPADEAMAKAMRDVQDARNELRTGAPFEEDPYDAVKQKVLRAMQNRGFAHAKVEGRVDVDMARHVAEVELATEMGPYCAFGPVSIVGLGGMPEKPLRRMIDLSGPFSLDALEAAEYAIAELGVFGAIEITPDLGPPGARSTVIPVTIRVQPAKLREVKLGIGAQAETTRVETHGIAGWEDRNLLGGYRRLSIDGRPGLVLYPSRIDTLFQEPPKRVLPELRLGVGFLQPALPLGTSFDARVAFNLYQLQPATPEALQKPKEDEEPNILGYRELVWTVGLSRRFTGQRLILGRLTFNIQRDTPFSYNRSEPPAGFSDLTLSWLGWLVSMDYRRGVNEKPDSIRPHSGVFLQWDAQVAGFGDARDVRLRPELRAYAPISRRVTLAFKLGSGLLFPLDYGDALTGDTASTAAECSDLQLFQFRALYSGGPNSNRGYGYNQVGRHVAATCNLANQTVATGGLTLWESSLELRYPVYGSLGGVAFLDASDVAPGRLDFHFERPHLTAGVGLRLDTPVGPFRTDVGFRVPCAQIIGDRAQGGSVCQDVPRNERQDDVFGLPIAVSLAIGEAF